MNHDCILITLKREYCGFSDCVSVMIPFCSILRSRANQLQCDYLLMLTTSEILTNTLVKVNVFLRPYLAGASLRRMTHYTRTWMNIDDNLIHLPIECKGKSLQKEQKLRKGFRVLF